MIIILGFEILYHLNKKISLLQKLLQKKKLFIVVFVFLLFCLLPKSLKLPSGLTKLCSFVNKDYYYYILILEGNFMGFFINK